MGVDFFWTLLEFLTAVGVFPPGFGFHPTDVVLVMYYLKKKVTGKPHFKAIEELDLYKFAPWDLPAKSRLESRDLEWYFFCPRNRKYANGKRKHRSTEIGFWKSSGEDRPVCHNSQTVGMIKTLIFHIGRAPKGNRTDWVMHEYRLEDKNLVDAGIPQDAYVLCKIFKKSGRGPKNGEQHGAPFEEEDVVNGPSELVSFADRGSSSLAPADDQTITVENSALVLGNTRMSSLEFPCQTVSSSNAVVEHPSLPAELKRIYEFHFPNSLENEMEDGMGLTDLVNPIEYPTNGSEQIPCEDPCGRDNANNNLEGFCNSTLPVDAILPTSGVSTSHALVPTRMKCPVEDNGSEHIPCEDPHFYNNYDNLGGICNSGLPSDVVLPPSGISMPHSLVPTGSAIFEAKLAMVSKDMDQTLLGDESFIYWSDLEFPLECSIEANGSEHIPNCYINYGSSEVLYNSGSGIFEDNMAMVSKDNGFGGNAIPGYDSAYNLAAAWGGRAEENGNTDASLYPHWHFDARNHDTQGQ